MLGGRRHSTMPWPWSSQTPCFASANAYRSLEYCRQILKYVWIPNFCWSYDACTQVKMEDASTLLKILKSECPDIWIRQPRHRWPKSWSNVEDSVIPHERNLFGPTLAGLLWERQFEEVPLESGWEKVAKLECLFVHTWMTSRLLEGSKPQSYVEEIDETRSTRRTDITLGMHSTWMQIERKYCWWKEKNVRIASFRVSNWKIAWLGKLPREQHLLEPMTWKDMQRNAWTILRIGEKNDSATVQGLHTMDWRPSLQKIRIGNGGRIFKHMLSNRPQMSALGTYW